MDAINHLLGPPSLPSVFRNDNFYKQRASCAFCIKRLEFTTSLLTRLICHQHWCNSCCINMIKYDMKYDMNMTFYLFPPVSTRLKFADHSFHNSSPHLWNSLPINLRSFTPDTHHSSAVIRSTPSQPFKALSLSRNQFLSLLKTHLFSLSYPP